MPNPHAAPVNKPIPAARKQKMRDFLVSKGHKLSDLRKQKAWKAGQDAQDTDEDSLRESLIRLHCPADQYEEFREMYRRIVGK